MTMPADARAPRPRAASLGREEAGFSLIEVMVAIVLLAIGSLAVLRVFDAATRNTFRAEQAQVAVNVAQGELEEIRNLSFNQVALTALPAVAAGPNDPRTRIDGTRFDIDKSGTMADLVYNGGPLDGGGQVAGGTVVSGPQTFTSGDISGQIFRYIVWRNDSSCTPTECPGSQDIKRAIVAVRLDTVASSYQRPYIEVHSDFVNPTDNATTDPPAGSEAKTAQQFWLTDTTCNHNNAQPIVTSDPTPEGHSLHNTLGQCTDGLQTGTTPGAPDLLGTKAPPDPNPASSTDPLIYDYATDLERPGGEPDDDGGLQITRQATNGCSFTGGTGANPHQRIHRWVSAPIDGSRLPGGFVMKGAATLEVFLRTLGGAQHAGRICVYVFRRAAAVDTVIASEQVLVPNWPSTEWSKLRFSLTPFAQTTVAPGQRVGLAISIERAGTPADTVQVLYDHPEARSRLEVETTTPFGD